MNREQNDSFNETTGRPARGLLWGVIGTFNLLLAVASGGFAVAALINPGLLLTDGGERTPAVDFYVKYYAVRSLCLSSLTVVLALLGSSNWLGALLIVVGLIQAGDALIGASYGSWSQTLLPAVAAASHLASASWLLRHRLRPWRD